MSGRATLLNTALLSAFFLWPPAMLANVAVEMRLPVTKALVNEPLNAEVSIRNASGRLLSFGTDPDSAKLTFHIEDTHGRILWPLSKASILDGAEILPGRTRTFRVALSRHFRFGAARTYKAQAVVEWGTVSYSSRTLWLDVVRGVEIVRTRAGFPGDESAMRIYILEYIQRGKEEFLYLRIEDEGEGIVYGVFNLGRVIRARKPSLETDEPGNVHVLFQTVGLNLVHASYTPYGEFLFSKLIGDVGGDAAALRELPGGQMDVIIRPAAE